MDDAYLKTSDAEIDLESGGNTSEEDGKRTHTLIAVSTNKLKRACSGFPSVESPDNYARDGILLNPCEKFSDPDEAVFNNIKRKDKRSENTMNSKDKKTVKNKPSKPPRPPRGPSMNDAADLKLVKEISKLAMLKRQRTERMKAMKKTKREKLPFSKSGNFLAMVVTVIFFIIIVCQGFLGSRA